MKQNSIIINNLNKIFITRNGQQVKALDGINLEIAANDFICLLGPSGCGKSTLLRILAGLEQSSSGSVKYRGKEMHKPTRKIGMVFQEYSLLPWRTVEDNIVLGLEFRGLKRNERHKVARRYLQMVGMEGFAQAFPYELSGGMQQRVAIVRALANDPDIILMDEPFGALDAHTRFIMQKELLQIWEQNRKTVIFVTHSVDEAIYLADRIVVMSARPGIVKEIINLDIPRPRTRSHPAYGQLADRVLSMLEEESALV